MNGRYSPGTLLGNASWTAPVYTGLVTQITAYKLVNSLTDLQNISLDLAGNYALGKDTLGSAATSLTGQFDGMWHVIDQFSQNEIYSPSGTKAIGLFGEIGTAGVVRKSASRTPHSMRDKTTSSTTCRLLSLSAFWRGATAA